MTSIFSQYSVYAVPKPEEKQYHFFFFLRVKYGQVFGKDAEVTVSLLQGKCREEIYCLLYYGQCPWNSHSKDTIVS